MRVLLFTILNCSVCDKHQHELVELAKNMDVCLKVHNIDDPRNFHISLKAMKLYGIRKTPSIILLDESNKMIACIQGIPNSIEKLKEKINEERNSN